MTMEYAWSQIEPATAILCACIVTYRPLFNNIRVNLSKFSGVLSYGRHDSTVTNRHWTDMDNDPRNVLRWPVSRDFKGQELSDLESLKTTVDPTQAHGCSCPEHQVGRRVYELCKPWLSWVDLRQTIWNVSLPHPFRRLNLSVDTSTNPTFLSSGSFIDRSSTTSNVGCCCSKTRLFPPCVEV